jgi:multiple antibiotic resistance protein
MSSQVFDLISGSWLHIYLGSLALLLTIMNPLGMLAIFLGTTANYSTTERKHISIKTSITIAIILITVTWLGTGVLNFFGVTLSAFEVTGGILLFIGCFPMVRPRVTKPMSDNDSPLDDDIAIVPLAFPIVSGPASILQVMMCLQLYGNDFESKIILTLASLTATLVLFLFFYYSEFFMKIIGINGLRIIKIFVGIILLSIAVDIIAKGIIGLFNLKLLLQ